MPFRHRFRREQKIAHYLSSWRPPARSAAWSRPRRIRARTASQEGEFYQHPEMLRSAGWRARALPEPWMKSRVLPASAASIALAAERLRAGELVAFPTETVYGLGADAGNADAVHRIFAAKGRPSDHPVIVQVAQPEDVARWTRAFPPLAQALARAFWPGPLTL